MHGSIKVKYNKSVCK